MTLVVGQWCIRLRFRAGFWTLGLFSDCLVQEVTVRWIKGAVVKKWLGSILALVLVFAAVLPVSAAPPRILTRDILDKFLKDFPLVQAELEGLEAELAEEFSGFQMDDDDFQMEDGGFPTLESISAGIMAVMLNPKVNAILARYGWTEVFMETYVSVLTGYTYLAFEELFLAYPLPQLKEVMDQLSPGLHPDDLALLKEYRTRIEMVLDVDSGL